MTSETGAVGTGAFYAHSGERPDPANQSCSSAKPVVVVANHSTPNTPPFTSTAAATCTSRCVSTPPVTGRALYDGHRHFFSLKRFKGRHARPGKETVTNRCGNSDSTTLRNGACHYHRSSPRRHAPNEPQCFQRVRPNRRATGPERSGHHQHDGGPTQPALPPYSLGNLGASGSRRAARIWPVGGARTVRTRSGRVRVGATSLSRKGVRGVARPLLI